MPAPNRLLVGLALLVLGFVYVAWGANVVQQALKPQWGPQPDWRTHSTGEPLTSDPDPPAGAKPKPAARRSPRGGTS